MYSVIILLVNLTFLQIALAVQCTTPNGAKGTCVSILNCPILLNAIASLDEYQLKFVKKFQCGYLKTALVCCPACVASNTSKTIEELLPSKKYCGYQHTDDYYTDNNRTQPNIDEFPWLTNLIHLNAENESVIVCGGTLINNRYLLTAAHCAQDRYLKLIGVRLGDNNLGEDKDCAENAQVEDCAEPVIEYGVEEIKVHPGYIPRVGKDDIALIRLNHTVTYSDFIRPICLPLPGTKLAKLGDTLAVTGWASSMLGGKPTNSKTKGLSELLPNEECRRIYGSSRRVDITNKHSCTKAKSIGDDSGCQGNSGGPVMFSNSNQWHIEGFHSMGSACGIGSPDINTNVVPYLSWILENIRE